jgi:aminoglycoside N3'-acetyltransferase/acyl carrier protein
MNNSLPLDNTPFLSQIAVSHIDSIVITTVSIDRTLSEYLSLPDSHLLNGPDKNDFQHFNVALIRISTELKIKIISPLGDDSPLHKILSTSEKKYHICYAVDDIDTTINTALKTGAEYIFPLYSDPTLDNRKTVVLLHPTHGLVEFVETSPILSNPKTSYSNDTSEINNDSAKIERHKIDTIFRTLMPTITISDIYNASMINTPEWDSLMQIKIIMALELELKCTISSTTFEKLTSYKEISDWIKTKVNINDGVVSSNNDYSSKRNLKKEKNDARIFKSSIHSALIKYEKKPTIIHTDIINAAPFIADQDKGNPLDAHRKLFDSLPCNYLIPAFNYQFPKLKKLDLRTAPVEVGSLNQYFHECKWADYRTFDPMFSFLGRGTSPFKPRSSLYAFGEESIFSYVVKQSGAILMYGATMKALTLIHYIERDFGGVPYRYNKSFSGELIDYQGDSHAIQWNTHVRPWEHYLDYDWEKVEHVLIKSGVVKPLVKGYPKLGFYMDARTCVEVLKTELHKDPLIFLNSVSRDWVEPKLNVLGRSFLLSDFENEE